MPATNRTAFFAKLQKILKKHYKPVAPTERPLLEQLLYACCLENARFDAADKAYRVLSEQFFDWNEVRVSTVSELAEALSMLPDAAGAATRVRKILQGVFESTYSFDLETLRKPSQGQPVQRLQALPGATPFSVSCVCQWMLGRHMIPVDRGVLDACAVLGVVDEEHRTEGTIQGLERAISKSKGIEFGSLLHQLGADFVANPYSTDLHKLLLEIAPDAKPNLPKRPPKKPAAEPAHPPAKKGAADEAANGDKAARPAERKESPAAAAEASRLAKKKPDAKREHDSKKDHEAKRASAEHRGKPERKKSATAVVSKRKPR